MVTATFEEGKRILRVLGLWQYDHDQVLRIEGLNLPAMTQVHFATSEWDGETTNRVASTSNKITTVTIPDALLRECLQQ